MILTHIIPRWCRRWLRLARKFATSGRSSTRSKMSIWNSFNRWNVLTFQRLEVQHDQHHRASSERMAGIQAAAHAVAEHSDRAALPDAHPIGRAVCDRHSTIGRQY